MNTAELDAFFAKVDDVLTDWEPGDDAMVACVPEDDSGDDLAPPGDSYYSQRRGGVFPDWLSGWLSDRLALDYARHMSETVERLRCSVSRPFAIMDEASGWTTFTEPIGITGMIANINALAASVAQDEEPARPGVLSDFDARVITATLGTNGAAGAWVRLAAGEMPTRPSAVAELRERKPDLFYPPAAPLRLRGIDDNHRGSRLA